jgi:hypothetical protein
MEVTEFGIAMETKLLHPWNTTVVKEVSVEEAWKVTEFNKVQFKNAPLPMNVTVFGIVMEVNFTQPLKDP